MHRGMYAGMPVSEFKGRVARAQEAMRKTGIDAMFLSQLENVWYFTGFKTWLKISKHRPFTALVPQDGDPVLIIPPIEEGDGDAFSWVDDLRLWPNYGSGYVDQWADLMREKGLANATIGAEIGADTQMGMSHHDFTNLTSKLPGANFVDCAKMLWSIRCVKSPLEVERIEKACRATDAGIAAVWDALRPGVTERDLARACGVAMMENGADVPAFLIVRSGNDGMKTWNQYATDRVIQDGDLVGLDVGCQHMEYFADMIRIGCAGKPTPEAVKTQAAAARIAQTVRDAIRPGMVIDDLDKVRRDAIRESGYRQAWDGMGHMIGITVHELPRIGPDVHDILLPGMVFTIEPGILAEDGWLFGVEDLVLVTETGARTLCHAERQLVVGRG